MNERTHTFGGSHLDRHVFDFETAIEPTEADIAANLETSSAGDTAPVDGGVQPETPGVPSPEPEAPAEASPAAIDWNDPTVAQAVEERARATFQAMIEEARVAAQTPVDQPQGFDWTTLDPFADDFGSQLAAGLQTIVGDAIAPLMPVVESTQAREAQEWTDGQLEKLGVPTEPPEELGENGVSTKDALLYYAGGVEQAAQEAGLRVTGEQILEHAWKQLQSRDERIGAAAVAKFKAELDGIDTAPKDPGGVTPAGEGLLDADDELAVARLIAERRSA